MTVPVMFRGTYHLRNPQSLARTDSLSLADGETEIGEAMAKIYPDGRVKVTVPDDGVVRFEWLGDYIGLDMPPVEVFVDTAPPGDPTLTLDCRLASIYAALRESESYDAVIEARAVLARDGVPQGEPLVLFRAPMAVVRGQNWDGMATQVTPLWLRPPNPVDYVPYTEDQVMIGAAQYRAIIGDGVATTIEVDHGLDSQDVTAITVRENSTPGDVVGGWTAEVTGNDTVTLTFAAAPAVDSLVVMVTVAGQVDAFQAHTHTVQQVVGLEDILEDLTGRVVTLEGVLPSTGPVATAADDSGMKIELPETQEILFFKGAVKDAWGKDGVDASKLGRAPLMLPAVHDATVTSYTTGDLPAIAAGEVWSNDSPGALEMGRGMYGGRVPVGGYFASDGRVRYAVAHSGSSTSFFPVGFERELWRIFISAEMLRVNRALDVRFGLGTQLVGASSNAQWMLVIEKGTAPSQATPATTSTNLENVVWSATPILAQRLILTQNRQTHSFGTRIKRQLVALVDTLSLDMMRYGVWEGNNPAAPSAANFALRARLINFDTENALATDARGWITYEILPVGDGEKPIATINSI